MSRCPLLDASLRRKQGNEWQLYYVSPLLLPNLAVMRSHIHMHESGTDEKEKQQLKANKLQQ
ncbi:hypothetical protein TSUD_119040, partial [Trifolium subterraneum]